MEANFEDMIRSTNSLADVRKVLQEWFSGGSTRFYGTTNKNFK